MSWKKRPGTAPTQRELNTLALCLIHGYKEAAYLLGIHPQTVKMLILSISQRMGTSGMRETADKLGWFDSIPPELRKALSGPKRHQGRAPRSG